MSLPKLSVERPIFISSLVLLMLFTGLVAFKKLPVSLFPETTVPFVSVSTLYPGAGPKEIETAISNHLEDEFSTLEGVKKINATSQDSLSIVWIEFKSGTNLDAAEQRVRDKVALARAKFPKDAESPLIERFNPSNQPVVTAFVEAEKMSITEISTWADLKLKPVLSRVPKVGRVEIIGGQKRQIDVIIDPQKIADYRIPLLQVTEALSRGGANVPGGSLSSGDKEIGIRSIGQYDSIDKITEKVLAFGNGETPLRVKDIGRVVDSNEKARSKAIFKGRTGLIIQVYKQAGANTIEVADSVKESLSQFSAKASPGVPQITVVKDGSKMIRDNVFDVWETIVIGIILTIIVVYFFLGSFRSTIITGFAIPNSLIGAFALMALAGFSINILTLLALSLCVGLVVDDAIVVRENIFKKLEEGMPAREASIIGANEVAMAVIATSAAIIAMFGPVGFLQGVTGQFFKEFGLVICFAMLISTFDGMAVAPMLSAYWGGEHFDKHGKKNFLQKLVLAFDRFQSWLEKIYEGALNLLTKKPLISTMAIAFVAILLSLTVLKLPSAFLPTDQSSDFNVRVQLPVGSSLKATEETALKVDHYLSGQHYIDYTVVSVGNSLQEIHKSDIYVKLKSQKERKGKKPSELREQLQSDFLKLSTINPETEIRVLQNDLGGGGLRPFNVLVQAANIDDLKIVSNKVFNRLKENKLLLAPELELRPGADELQIKLRDKDAQKLGITPVTAGLEIRTRIEGAEVGKYREQGQEYPIKVRIQDSPEVWLKQSSKILVPNVNMTPVDLNKVADFVYTQSPAKVERVNKAYSARITADLSSGASLADLMKEVDLIIEQESNGIKGVSRIYEGDAESYDELSESMSMAFLFGIVLLFLVLASLYESFLLSFLNIITLPLAVSGAFLALLMFDEGLNIYSIIGILLLLGVATKNSILLIDTAKGRLGENGGADFVNEIIHASVRRLRPILMTSLALIAGTIPIAIGLNEASATRTGMGVAIVGGVVTSTLFTLVFVPCMLVVVQKIKSRFFLKAS
jgi:HAE1 family hydrophobic/amphiphilic exporter-1